MKPLWEVLIVFALVMFVIWVSESALPISCLLTVPAVFLMLNYWRENPEKFKNLWKPAGQEFYYILFILAFAGFWRLIAIIGDIWNPQFWNEPRLLQKFTISVLFYLGNALWQQILVNGYFLPRLEEGLQNEKKSICALGLLFGLVHIPNPVLVPVTMIGGMLSAYFFKRTNNIYILIIAHSILAISAMYFLPEAWHHHLRVGPGYFHWLR